jgi:hypothetical protein
MGMKIAVPWWVLCRLGCAAVLIVGLASAAAAQDSNSAIAPIIPPGGLMGPRHENEPQGPRNPLLLSALLSATDLTPIHSGLKWRVFDDATEADGTHKLVAESNEAAPSLALPDGTYIIHCTMGLASITQHVTMAGAPMSERVVLNAGGLRIVPVLGDEPINPSKLSISIYVPQRNNAEAKLILSKARAGDIIGLPEGNYHVVSTLLDTSGIGALAQNGFANATNSVVNADLHVQAGKLTDVTLRHRAAVMTLKLVNAPGGEALANSAFTILTPGGDVIRELIGAFPSLVLAEGEYVAIARHGSRTYQATFNVESTRDRDVEIVAR